MPISLGMEDLLPFEKIQRSVLLRMESETNWSYGEDPNKRKIGRLIDYGIINLNKPANPTSHQVSDYVQKILGIEKAGHSGTLVL